MDGYESPDFHLAQVNVMRTVTDIADLPEFVELFEPIGALAEGSPGFVWRQPTSDAISAGETHLGTGGILMLSTWKTPRDLWNFAYASRHLDAMRQRREWTVRLTEAAVALWWSLPGDPPSAIEGYRRLSLLRRVGPTPESFTFRRLFPPPAVRVREPVGRSSAHRESGDVGGFWLGGGEVASAPQHSTPDTPPSAPDPHADARWLTTDNGETETH